MNASIYNNASPHFYLRIRHPHLETQFQSLKMKISRSIAHLDPLLMLKLQSIWDVGGKYGEQYVKECSRSSMRMVLQTMDIDSIAGKVSR